MQMRRACFIVPVVITCAVLTNDGAFAQQMPAPPAASPRAPAAPAVAPTLRVQLPNGASSINETYGDWTVDCRLVDGQKRCQLSQAQGNNQTGQKVFAIELRTPKDGKTEGTILMPFGLNLDAGAVLKLEDKDLGKGVHFSTCVPQGCLLPVSFPIVATDAMKKATKLTIASLNLSSGEAVTFNISLNGFAAALARVSDLGR